MWTLTFSSAELRLTSRGAPDRVVDYANRFEGIKRYRNDTLVALTERRMLFLESSPELRASLDAWVGRPSREHLRRRLAKFVGSGAANGSALVLWGVFDEGMRGTALSLGLPLLVMGLVSRFVVHRALFAAMAVIYAANVLVLAAFIIGGASPWLWLLVVLILFGSSSQMREHRTFAEMDDAPTP